MPQPSFLICSLLIILIPVGGCRKEAPRGKPLTDSERVQFNDPLELSCWQEPGGWPQFGHDPLHTGRSDVDLGTADLGLAWTFRPSEHVWTYRPGFSVWSSPVVGTVQGRSLVIAGYHDRNVYAIDGVTGKQVWAFRPGKPVFATPALGRVQGRDLVFVASLNRSIYGLDAATGELRWQFETVPWSFTQSSTFMSSPTIVRDGDTAVLVIGVWNSDRAADLNVRSAEVIVLDAADGSLRWRRPLGSVPLTSPAVARLDGELTVFIATHHGMVHALGLADGSKRWASVLNEETRSSPSLGLVDGMGCAFIGSRLNSLFALDLRTGVRRWREDTRYWIDSTPAWFSARAEIAGEPETTVVVGSYDRNVYAWTATDRRLRWKVPTGNFAYASTALARLNGRPVVLAMSWDQNSYLFDGMTGETLWQVECGPLLWSHAYMGDSLWASPVVARVGGRPTILIAAYDGILYAYQAGLTGASRPGG